MYHARPVDAPDDPLSMARARLEETLGTLSGAANDPAMILVARNAIEALGSLGRFGVQPGEMARAVARTGEAVRRFLDRDPGETLALVLLDKRAAALADVVRERGDLAQLDEEDRQNWIEEAFEIFAARDAADAWLLGAAALLRWFEPGAERTHLERVRERAVIAIERFDHALAPALGGLSPLRETAKTAIMRARADKGYLRRARWWLGVLES
jgi:hypothetical protein